jgi:thiol-disulfide isomerase/thioredoxin/YHS domain-containing protein
MAMRIFAAFSVSLASIFLLFCPHVNANDSIPWVQDIEQAKSIAAQNNKPILLHFWGDYCPPCRRLEAVVFPHPTVARTFSENVVPVKVNVKVNPELARQYGIDRIPSDVVISPAGHVIVSRPSPSSSDAYIKFCEQVTVAYSKASDQKYQIASQLQRATDSVEQNSRAQQGMPPRQYDNHDLAGNSSWSAHPGIDSASNLSNQGGSVQGAVSDQAAGSDQTQQSLNQHRQRISNQFVAQSNQPENPGSAVEHQPTTNATNPSGQTVAVQQQSSFNPNMKSGDQNAMDQLTTEKAVNTLLDTSNQSHMMNSHANRPFNTDPGLGNPSNTASANGQFSVGDSNAGTSGNAGMAGLVNTGTSVAITDQNVVRTGLSQPSNGPSLPANIGIDAYCPVELMLRQKWVKGDPRWGAVHREKTYLFSSPEAMEIFFSDPDKYSPLLAGFDPVVFYHQGILKSGSREFGAFHVLDGQNESIVLCASDANRLAFKADPEKYIVAVIKAMSEIDEQTNNQ